MIEYPKILGPYRRHVDGPNKNQLIIGDWTKPEFEMLQNARWFWTEKIDGTNIRIHWDGHKPEFAGRTARAQLHKDLVSRLEELFPEELFEQEFGSTEVTLFGEGYGAGIQSGGNYSASKEFILFDVLIGGLWLSRDNIIDVAMKLGLAVVPLKFIGSPMQIIDLVQHRDIVSDWQNVVMEGVVGTVDCGLLDRRGNRIQMKVKLCDFPES